MDVLGVAWTVLRDVVPPRSGIPKGECEGIILNRRHHITIDGDRRGEERSKSEGEERHREQDYKTKKKVPKALHKGAKGTSQDGIQHKILGAFTNKANTKTPIKDTQRHHTM